jgi:ABC-type molybdate transport system ATPase subunit
MNSRRSHQPVDEQRLSAGIRMSDEYRVKMVRYAADVARAVRLADAVVLIDDGRIDYASTALSL